MIEENEQKRQQEIEQRRASTNFSRDYNEDRLERFLAKQSILEKRSRDIIKEKESELDSLESQQSKKYNTELMDDVIANTRKDINAFIDKIMSIEVVEENEYRKNILKQKQNAWNEMVELLNSQGIDDSYFKETNPYPKTIEDLLTQYEIATKDKRKKGNNFVENDEFDQAAKAIGLSYDDYKKLTRFRQEFLREKLKQPLEDLKKANKIIEKERDKSRRILEENIILKTEIDKFESMSEEGYSPFNVIKESQNDIDRRKNFDRELRIIRDLEKRDHIRKVFERGGSDEYLFKLMRQAVRDQIIEDYTQNIDTILSSTSSITKKGDIYGKVTYEDSGLFKKLKEVRKMGERKTKQALEEGNHDPLVRRMLEIQKGIYDDRKANDTIYRYEPDESLVNKIKNLMFDLSKVVETSKKELNEMKLKNLEETFKITNDVYIDILKSPTKKKANIDWLVEKAANLNNFIEFITNKETSKKLSLTRNEIDYKNALFKKTTDLFDKIKSALNVTSDDMLLTKLKDLNEPLFKVKPEARDVLGNYIVEPVNISKLNLIYIQLQLRNPETAKSIKKYYANDMAEIRSYIGYSNEEIEKMSEDQKIDREFNGENVSNTMDPQLLKIADILFESTQDWEELNPYYIIEYNTDLGRVDNYFPRSSYHTTAFSAFNHNIQERDKTITATKHREFNAVPRLDMNPILMAIRHAEQTEYVKNIATKYKNVRTILTNDKIKQAIVNKYDNDFYNVLMRQLQRIGLSNYTQESKIDQVIGELIGNLANSVTNTGRVAIKQFTSALSYSDGLPKKQYYKNLLDTIMNPKEASDFLHKNSEYIKYRYNNSDTQDIIKEMRNYDKNPLFKKIDWLRNNKVTKIFDYIMSPGGRSLLEWGDYASVVFGGYARYKTNIQNGMSHEDAIADFEKHTTETQQSDLKTLKSDFENGTGIGHTLVTLFKSQDFQQLNKVLEADIMFMNKEGTGKDVIDKYLLYKVLPSILIRLMLIPVYKKVIDELYKNLLADDDEEKKIKKKQKNYGYINLRTLLWTLIDITPFAATFTVSGTDLFNTGDNGKLDKQKLIETVIGGATGLPGHKTVETIKSPFKLIKK
ncbi:MAG: hypothetical protein LBH46_01330 [Rickettsiales bacterium]|jgi:hypothetical protein|nr:hypothetical protein [Rickettsiales bacterium]